MPLDDVERVLRVVESLPRGRVTTYGDIADLLGLGPRQVGAIMSNYGGSVPWWRVTRADGRLAEHLLDEASQHWHEEGIPVRADGRGCQISLCRISAKLETL